MTLSSSPPKDHSSVSAEGDDEIEWLQVSVEKLPWKSFKVILTGDSGTLKSVISACIDADKVFDASREQELPGLLKYFRKEVRRYEAQGHKFRDLAEQIAKVHNQDRLNRMKEGIIDVRLGVHWQEGTKISVLAIPEGERLNGCSATAEKVYHERLFCIPGGSKLTAADRVDLARIDAFWESVSANILEGDTKRSKMYGTSAPPSPTRWPQAIPLVKNVNAKSLAVTRDSIEAGGGGGWTVSILGDSVTLKTIFDWLEDFFSKSDGVPFKSFNFTGANSPTQLAAVRHFRQKLMRGDNDDLDYISLARQFCALYTQSFGNTAYSSGRLTIHIPPTGQESPLTDEAEILSDEERKEAHVVIQQAQMERKGVRLVQPDEVSLSHPAIDPPKGS